MLEPFGLTTTLSARSLMMSARVFESSPSSFFSSLAARLGGLTHWAADLLFFLGETTGMFVDSFYPLVEASCLVLPEAIDTPVVL